MFRFKTLCCALVLLSITGVTYAQSPEKEVTSTIRLKILPDRVAEFEALVAQLARDANAKEPGTKFYEIRRVKNEPLTYLYFMSFKDKAAYDRYSAADWHRQMSPKAAACMDGPAIFEDLESFY